MAAVTLPAQDVYGPIDSAGSLFGREANAFDIRDFLGHSRVSTSDRYTHTRFDDEYFERLNRAFGDRRRGAA